MFGCKNFENSCLGAFAIIQILPSKSGFVNAHCPYSIHNIEDLKILEDKSGWWYLKFYHQTKYLKCSRDEP